mgnify:CR=1 FL=1
MSDFLEGLNPPQRQAAEKLKGPLLILAGAGSGKTRVVTQAVARVIAEGFGAGGILCITFTNRAADEMRRRIAESAGTPAASVRIHTFHGWCATLCRAYPKKTGRTSDFVIYDQDDVDELYAMVASELGIAPHGGAKRVKARAAKAGASIALANLYRDYLAAYNAHDFDSLQRFALRAMASPAARANIAGLHHIFVDEYQDTSETQTEVINEALAIVRESAAHRAMRGQPVSILRVGDPAQAIYEWRGARPQNILDVAAADHVKTLQLDVNYRSRPAIVTVGNRIAAAVGSPLVGVRSGRDDADGVVVVHEHATMRDRDNVIADKIAYACMTGSAPSDFAVIARTWAELDGVAQALHGSVPVHFGREAADRWSSTSMRHLVAGMRCATNPRDGVAVRRLSAWPTRDLTDRQILRMEVDPAPVVVAAASVSPRVAAATSFTTDCPSTWSHAYLNWWSNADALVDAVAEVSEWASANPGEDVAGFLRWYGARQLSDMTTTDPDAGPVRLLTVHAMKGLEARIVHVVGLDGRVWPRGRGSAEDLRCFYVACTRAQDELHLHHSRLRPARDGSSVAHAPSPFISIATD